MQFSREGEGRRKKKKTIENLFSVWNSLLVYQITQNLYNMKPFWLVEAQLLMNAKTLKLFPSTQIMGIKYWNQYGLYQREYVLHSQY